MIHRPMRRRMARCPSQTSICSTLACPRLDAEHSRHRRERQAKHLLTLPFAGRKAVIFVLHGPVSSSTAVHGRVGADRRHTPIDGTPGRQPQSDAPTLSLRAERGRPSNLSVRLAQPEPTATKSVLTSWRTTPSLDHRNDDNVTGHGVVRRGCV